MAGLFGDGLVAVLVLLVLAAEAAWLIRCHRAGRGGLPPREALLLVLPGAALVAALQAALWGLHWSFMALALLAAFVAHLLDLGVRLRR